MQHVWWFGAEGREGSEGQGRVLREERSKIRQLREERSKIRQVKVRV